MNRKSRMLGLLAVAIFSLDFQAISVAPSDTSAANYALNQYTNRGVIVFSNGQPRAVTGAFLIDLICRSENESAPAPFSITGAEIIGEFKLSNVSCPRELRFQHCRFTAPVDLRKTHFQNSVSFTDCVFEETVDLQDLTVDAHLDLSRSAFRQWIATSFAEIKGNLLANGAFFADSALLNQMNVKLSVDFDSSLLIDSLPETAAFTRQHAIAFVTEVAQDNDGFAQPAFRFARHGFGAPTGEHLQKGEWLLIDDATLRMFSVSFNTDKLNLRRKTYFAKGIDLTSSSVGSFLNANAVCFSGAIIANNVKVAGGLYLNGSQLEKGLSLGYADLGNELSVASCEFISSAATDFPNFYGIKVGRVLMNDAWFGGRVQFDHSTVFTALEARNATFADTNLCASFYGIKAKEADFSAAEFAGGANFSSAALSKITFHGAWFTNAGQPATFYGLQIDGTASFEHVVFAGPVNFLLADVGGNMEFENARFDNALHPDRLAALTHGVSTYNADFGSMRVGGFANYSLAQMAGRISFRNATLENLHFDETQLIHPRRTTNEFRLEGLAYKAIRATTNVYSRHSSAEMQETWTTLKALLKAHTPYSFDIYDKLENFFRREGERDLADAVFIAGKRRERDEIMNWWSPSFLFSWILDLTVAYGRHPSYALFYSAFFVFLGCFLFRRPYMVSSDGEPPAVVEQLPVEQPVLAAEISRSEASQFTQVDLDLRRTTRRKPVSHATPPQKYPYSPLWFSLDLFVPVIDLWADDRWLPKPNDKLRWWYMRLHKILGWILIPIGLAAFSGIIG